MTEGTLLLWGDVAVGKTTLLTTGLLAHRDRLPEIDWAAEPLEEKKRLFHSWQALRENRRLPGTLRVNTLELALGNGNRLSVRDVQGMMVRQPFDEPTFRQPTRQRGVLFVCEWQGAEIASHLTAVEAALNFCRDVHVGLALTKCERGLEADDPHWAAPLEWWAEHECWKPYGHILSQFKERVWPTSAYGFDDEGRPACLLGEFGQVLPYRIRPRNVEAPFRWYFTEMGLWQK